MKPSAAKLKTQDLQRRQKAPLVRPTDLTAAATKDIGGAMNAILADAFSRYLKTKTSIGRLVARTSVTTIHHRPIDSS